MPVVARVEAGEGGQGPHQRAVGVRRVSLGQAITQAAYTLVRKAAIEALTAGTYNSTSGADSFGDINGAFAAR